MIHPLFQENQFTCTASEKCFLVHVLEPMVTYTTHSMQTTKHYISTNNKITAVTAQDVKEKVFLFNDLIHPT